MGLSSMSLSIISFKDEGSIYPTGSQPYHRRRILCISLAKWQRRFGLLRAVMNISQIEGWDLGRSF